MGEDRANKAHEKKDRSYARTEDNLADIEQAAINLNRATTTGSATELVMNKAQPASCEAISATTRAETQARRPRTISLNVKYRRIHRIATKCLAMHDLAASERILGRVLRATSNQGLQHNRDHSLLRLDFRSPMKPADMAASCKILRRITAGCAPKRGTRQLLVAPQGLGWNARNISTTGSVQRINQQITGPDYKLLLHDC